ncbi:MAG: sulfide/dihydroorotate dehydrogenase-like FAD/NAD-binding protein [Christensenellales bacterium]|jgi:ferredoxin--NADP+ reductase
MYKILKKRVLNPTVTLMEIEAPLIARKAKAGQFIMLRVDDGGERIPLTVADTDESTGGVTIIFQKVGKTTNELDLLHEGDFLLDFVGPLGNASELEGVKKAAVIGGGLGAAIAYPQAKELHKLGAEVHAILGFRSKELVILEDEMEACSSELVVATDDGSYGVHGFVTDVLKQKIEQGNEYDLVVAIGPLIMMKMVSELTRSYGIKTVVSMNSVMVDGTGMCGGCRVTVDGETKFACVDGPDFDGHLVDFDQAMVRGGMYHRQEELSDEQHHCRLQEMGEKLDA